MKNINLKKYMLLVGMTAVFAFAGTISAFAKTRLETPTDLYWSNTTKTDDDHEKEGSIARWDEVEDAYNYLVYIYYEDSYLTKVEVKKNYYNFRSKMSKEGDYYFKVRAQAKNKSKEFSDSYWSAESDTYYVSASGASNSDIPEEQTTFIVSMDEWKQDGRGWWYKRANGSYPSNGWFQDPADGNWYYLDADGYMMTGWVETDGKKYYLDAAGSPSGAMVTGERMIDGMVYQFGEKGELLE